MAIPRVDDYLEHLPSFLAEHSSQPPWTLAGAVQLALSVALESLADEFDVHGQLAIHRSATVHASAVITGPAIIDDGVEVGPYCRLREGVYLGPGTHLGPSTELKSSVVGATTSLAHLNYVGNSVVGEGVNVEAGAVIANHFNERADKQIFVLVDGEPMVTGVTKFGAAIGAGSRIGANAVTTPGTLLDKHSVVGRLQLIDQVGSMRG